MNNVYCLLNLSPTSRTGEGRPLDDSDSLWLTRMDREAGWGSSYVSKVKTPIYKASGAK